MNSVRLPTVAATIFLLMIGGCVEQSIVVKVKADKTAVIQVRSYSEKPMFSVTSGDKKTERRVPSQKTLEAIAARLGAGVTIKELREGTNSSGWSGFDAVFLCDDISSVTLDTDLLTSMKIKETSESKGKENGGPPSKFKFSFEGSELRIENTMAIARSESGGTETRDPFAKAPPLPSSNPFSAALIEGIVKKIRIGTFVQIDGKIQSTNARHQDGDMIAIASLDGSKLNPASIQKLFQLKPSMSGYTDAMHRLADQTDGLEMDLQPMIRVQLAN